MPLPIRSPTERPDCLAAIRDQARRWRMRRELLMIQYRMAGVRQSHKHCGALHEPFPPVKAAAMRNDAQAGFRRSKNYASMQELERTPTA